MSIFKTSYEAVARRPIIIVLPAVLVLVLMILNSFNPILPILLGLSKATGTGFFEGMVSVMQLILDKQVILGTAFLMLSALLLVSIVSGIIFSGYLPIVAGTLEGKGKYRGEFWDGVRKHFFRLFLISLLSSLAAGALLIVMVVAAVPSIIITRAALVAKPELLVPAIIIDILTGLVLFFVYLFYKVYIVYWFPAAVRGLDMPFRMSKWLVDRHFFKLIGCLALFDIALAAILAIISLLPLAILKFLFGWIFVTAFVTVLIIHIFKSFGEIMIANSQDDRP